MHVLVVGGTNFIGPHVVDALLGAGHDVTVFNRGQTADTLPEKVHRLRGDRTADLGALDGRTFDATVDTCAYFPRAVDMLFDALEDPGYYCFISTLSVYASFAERGQDESAPVHEIADPAVEEVNGETYGGLKVLCERVVTRRAPRASSLRLGLVVGPGDNTDRFTYWPVRAADGGVMLAPGSPEDPLQWIDVRDVADFVRRCVTEQIEGTYNLVTPPGERSFGEVLRIAQRLSGADLEVCWVDSQHLDELELQPWIDLPAWLPSDGEQAGFAAFNSSAARSLGLQNSSTEFTVKSILDWWASLPPERRSLRAGLSREREGASLEMLRNNKPNVSLWRP